MKKIIIIILFMYVCVPDLYPQVTVTSWHNVNVKVTNNNLNDVAWADETTAVAVGDQGTIIRTTDGGVNWSDVPNNIRANLSAIDFSYNNGWGVIVGQSFADIRTCDKHGNWVNPPTYGVILVTTNYGETWYRLWHDEMGLFQNTIEVYNYENCRGDLQDYPTSVTPVVPSVDLHVWRSYNDVKIWTDISGQEKGFIVGSGSVLLEITYDPLRGPTIDDRFDIQLSDDYNISTDDPTVVEDWTDEDCKNWTRTITHHIPKDKGDYSWIDFWEDGANSLGIISGSGEVYYTTTRGLFWDKLSNLYNRGKVLPVSSDAYVYAAIYWDQWPYLEAPIKFIKGGFPPSISILDLYTQYFPLSPTATTLNALPEPGLLNISLDPVSNNAILPIQDGTIFKYNINNNPNVVYDDGMYNGPKEIVESVGFNKITGAGIAVGWYGTILTTTGINDSWTNNRQATTTMKNINSVHFPSSGNYGWACGDAGFIYKTTDGGDNWTLQNTKTGKDLNGIFFRNNDLGWAVGEDFTILKTTDGGDSWRDIIFVFPRPANDLIRKPHLNGVMFFNDLEGIAFGTDGYLIRTTNGGQSWDEISGKNIHGLQFTLTTGSIIGTLDFSGTLFAATPNTNTNNGYICGVTQRLLQANGTYSIERGVIFRTTDAGATWTCEMSDPNLNYTKGVWLRGIYSRDISANSVWVVGYKYMNYDDPVNNGTNIGRLELNSLGFIDRFTGSTSTFQNNNLCKKIVYDDVLIGSPSLRSTEDLPAHSPTTILNNVNDGWPYKLFSVHGGTQELYACGEGGYVTRFNGLRWDDRNIISNSSTNWDLNSIFLKDENNQDIVSVGNFGSIMKTFQKVIPRMPDINTNEKPGRNTGAEITGLYPNPANSVINFSYILQDESILGFDIDNLIGENVASIKNYTSMNGNNQVTVNVNNLADGIYFIKLKTSRNIVTAKFMIIK